MRITGWLGEAAGRRSRSPESPRERCIRDGFRVGVHNRYSRSHCSNAGVTWRHIADYHPARMNSGLRNDARDFAQLGTVSAGQR